MYRSRRYNVCVNTMEAAIEGVVMGEQSVLVAGQVLTLTF